MINSVIDALRIMIPQSKSLRDGSTESQTLDPQGNVALVHSGLPDGKGAFRKANVARWRMWAEYSWCVRTALDIHRNFSTLVLPSVTAVDPKKSVDKGVERALNDLLSQRMTSGDSYPEVKEKMLEDFFVVSHGIADISLKKNGQPTNINCLNAERIAFYRGWNGDPSQPRYAQIDSNNKVVRQLSDYQIMAMVNRKRSYDTLGLSHIECLETAVQAILAGDDHLLQELRYPSASGALNLGEGMPPNIADEVRQKIMAAAKHAFIVISGSKNAKFIPFKPNDLKRLDKQLWFVREVAALFGLPITVFAQSADSTRSNTIALLDQMAEGLRDTILRIKNSENNDIVAKFGPTSRHNLCIDYPILNSKDALKQAELTALQVADQPISSINEGRRENGLPKIDLPIADDILLQTSVGLISLTQMNEQVYDENGKVKPIVVPNTVADRPDGQVQQPPTAKPKKPKKPVSNEGN